MRKRLYLLLGIIFVLCMYGAYRVHTGYVHKARFTIVCTTTILADTIRNIVGDNAQVLTLMGPGIDPHLYRPREGDVHRLAEADLVFFHGLHLEGKLASILESLDRYAPTYAVSDAIPDVLLRRVDHGDLIDPHIWHAIPLWNRVVGYSADRCIEHDPEHAEIYRERAEIYSKQLLALHEHILDRIATIPPERRILVTAHDAFAYFGQTYGLEVVALQGISTEAEIGSWDVMHLVDLICERKVPGLFVETAIPHRTLQAVIDAVQVRGCSVQLGDELYADALGDANSDAATYVDMIMHNLNAIVQGLH